MGVTVKNNVWIALPPCSHRAVHKNENKFLKAHNPNKMSLFKSQQNFLLSEHADTNELRWSSPSGSDMTPSSCPCSSSGGRRRSRTRRRPRRRAAAVDLDITKDLQNLRTEESKKKVSFQPTALVHLIPFQQKTDDLWYDKREYLAMEHENNATLQMLRYSIPEKYGFCYRGLETRLEDEAREVAIEFSRDIVLQRYMKSNSVEDIAFAYGCVCRASELVAYQRALTDAELVDSATTKSAVQSSNSFPRQGVLVDQTPRKPRRTWARAG